MPDVDFGGRKKRRTTANRCSFQNRRRPKSVSVSSETNPVQTLFGRRGVTPIFHVFISSRTRTALRTRHGRKRRGRETRTGSEGVRGHAERAPVGGMVTHTRRKKRKKKYVLANTHTRTVQHVMRTTNYCSCHGLFICRWSFYSLGMWPNHERRKLLICVYGIQYTIYIRRVCVCVRCSPANRYGSGGGSLYREWKRV